MAILSFTDGWTYRRPLGPFAGVLGENAAPTPVRLPHDALRDTERRADATGKGAGAYYAPAAFTYLKQFEVPAEWEGRLVRLELQGAFRRAQIFLNDGLAGNRADGYARFFVDLTPYLTFGAANQLRVEVRAGEDSRWYSGAGLHRTVLRHVDRAIHIVPDGVRVETVRIEDDQAVVDVLTTVANAGLTTRTVRVHVSVTNAEDVQVEGDETPSTLAPGEQAIVRQWMYLPRPALWSPDHPSLYHAHVRLEGGQPKDEIVVSFGIRTITVDPRKGLRINGEPVLLRGGASTTTTGRWAPRRSDARRNGASSC